MQINGIVVLLSGGMDSSTLLAYAKTQFNNVKALSVDYAQRHKKELQSATQVSRHYNIEHIILDINNISELISNSSLTSSIPVPHGHYAEETMKSTVVPGRNTILLSIAAGMSASLGWDHVAFAAHAGDHAIYPDCRPKYVQAIAEVFKLFDYNPITLWAPFLHIDKTEILKRGLALGVPYELTWTCYEGRENACGKCGSCTERLEAFTLNNTKDPLTYE